jgi:hypothetical protein
MSFHSLIKIIFVLFIPSAALSDFKICAEPQNFPISEEKSHSGFEIEAAELIAKAMGKKLKVIWVTQKDHSYHRQTIGKKYL